MRTMLFIAATVAFALGTVDAGAAGGGGGGGGGAGGASEAVVNDADFQAAMAAVNKGDWNQVIARMTAYTRRIPGNADAWNELGHAYRKVGDLDNAFKHYAEALRIDPKHRNAHEYLGEAYLQAGNLARAEEELRVLDGLCFLPCEQYTDLKAQVRRYKADHPPLAAR